MQVVKWGKSLAVRLPAAVVEALEIKAGDEIELHVADGRRFDVARQSGHQELLVRLRAFRGRLPEDFKFDRDEANVDENQPLPALSRKRVLVDEGPKGELPLPPRGWLWRR